MTTAIEVAIGLILLYLTLSLVVSAIQEGIAAIVGLRARFLAKGIENLLGEALKGKFYEHGLVRALSKPKIKLTRRQRKYKKPSYISESTFSSVALDLISRIPDGQEAPVDSAPAAGEDALGSLNRLRERLEGMTSEVPAPLKSALLLFEREAANVAEVRVRLEGWFDETMERVSGWYKRRTKVILFVVGLVLSVALNADTLNVARVLWTDPEVRAAVVAAAEKAADEEKAPELTAEEAADAVGDLAELQIPLGWVFDPPREEEGRDPRELPEKELVPWLIKGGGLLITAIALTFGAPFWFDLLKKFVNLRSSGDSSGGEDEKKRGTPGPARVPGSG